MSFLVDAPMSMPDSALRLGGDPRVFAEFKTLRDELSKLTHPARPDVDWYQVEQLCLVLLQRNGVDMQTVACLALARSYRFGVAGALDGVELMANLLRRHGARAWPQSREQRLEILTWLFTQLQSLLRSLNLAANDLPEMAELEGALAQLHERLDRQLQLPVVALHRLRQVLRSAGQRLQQDQPYSLPSCSAVPVAGGRRRPPAVSSLCLWAVLGVAALLGVWWSVALLGLRTGLDFSAPMPAVSSLAEASEHVASLAVFRPGSAEFDVGSTNALITALASLKVRPGWLIVISGHSDSSGEVDANLQFSWARAAAVRDWLQRMAAIPDRCFAIQGWGDSQPVASNDTVSGRMTNRRVDIRQVQEEGACSRDT